MWPKGQVTLKYNRIGSNEKDNIPIVHVRKAKNSG